LDSIACLCSFIDRYSYGTVQGTRKVYATILYDGTVFLIDGATQCCGSGRFKKIISAQPTHTGKYKLTKRNINMLNMALVSEDGRLGAV
jgi:hypothetical protein